jgi:hypothetical protein
MSTEYKLKYTAQEIDERLKKTDEIDNKEETENKSTIINEDSTDEQYPSAKAVYDFVQEALYVDEEELV